MDAIADRDAAENMQSLLDRVARGEEVTIMRDGKPVAKVIPAQPIFDREAARAAAQGLLSLSRGTRLDGISIRELIEEGRRY